MKTVYYFRLPDDKLELEDPILLDKEFNLSKINGKFRDEDTEYIDGQIKTLSDTEIGMILEPRSGDEQFVVIEKLENKINIVRFEDLMEEFGNLTIKDISKNLSSIKKTLAVCSIEAKKVSDKEFKEIEFPWFY